MAGPTTKRGRLLLTSGILGAVLTVGAFGVATRTDNGPRKIGNTVLDKNGAPALTRVRPPETIELGAGAVWVVPVEWATGFTPDGPDDAQVYVAVNDEDPQVFPPTTGYGAPRKPGFATVGWFRTTPKPGATTVPIELAYTAAHLILPPYTYDRYPSSVLATRAGSLERVDELWHAENYLDKANRWIELMPTTGTHLVVSNFAPRSATADCLAITELVPLPAPCATFAAALLDTSGTRVIWENPHVAATQLPDGQWRISDSTVCRDLKEANEPC